MWVVIGCGYVGSALATRLVADGEEVIVTRRDPGNAARTARALGVEGRAYPGFTVPADATVVYTAPPPGDVPHARRVVYLSSTSVYGNAHGAWVTEEFPTEPDSVAGRARLAAERALDPGAIILRIAGIYGPGRNLGERIRIGNFRVVGAGASYVSRIHIVDLVDAIVRAGRSALAGPVNIADDEPGPIGEVADAIAARLGLPPVPRVSELTMDLASAGLLTSDRRIANTRMTRELGVVLRYPSWREGLFGDRARDRVT